MDNNIPHEIQVFPGVPHGQYLRFVQGLRLQLMLEQVLPLLENMRILRSWMRKRLHLSRCSPGSNLIDDCHELLLRRFGLCVTLSTNWRCKCVTREQLFGLSLTHHLSFFVVALYFKDPDLSAIPVDHCEVDLSVCGGELSTLTLDIYRNKQTLQVTVRQQPAM